MKIKIKEEAHELKKRIRTAERWIPYYEELNTLTAEQKGKLNEYRDDLEYCKLELNKINSSIANYWK